MFTIWERRVLSTILILCWMMGAIDTFSDHEEKSTSTLTIGHKVMTNSYPYGLLIWCKADIGLGGSPPTTMALQHVNTELSIKATNVFTTSQSTCKKSITVTNLYSKATPNDEAGITERARVASRYIQGVSCDINIGSSINRQLKIMIYDVTIYDLDEWRCVITTQNRFATSGEITKSVRYDSVQKLRPLSLGLEGNNPEVRASIHTNDDSIPSLKDHSYGIISCGVPNFDRRISYESFSSQRPFSSTSLVYEQAENDLNLPTGKFQVYADIYNRNTRPDFSGDKERAESHGRRNYHCDVGVTAYSKEAWYAEPQGMNIRDPTLSLFVCFDKEDDTWRPNYNAAKSGEEHNVDDEDDTGQTQRTNRTFTMAKKKFTAKKNLTPNPFSIRRIDDCTPYILLADDEIFKENISQHGTFLYHEDRINPYERNASIIHKRSIFTIIPNNCIAFLCEMSTIQLGKINSQRRTLVIKIPEHFMIEPFTISHQQPLIQDLSGSEIRNTSVKLIPDTKLTANFYKAYVRLVLDYKEVNVLTVPVEHANVSPFVFNCNVKVGRARILTIMNGLCHLNDESPLESWCGAANGLADWQVREIEVPRNKNISVFRRPSRWFFYGVSLDCLWRVYFCGTNPRIKSMAITELIIIRPKIPHPKTSTRVANAWDVKVNECSISQNESQQSNITTQKFKREWTKSYTVNSYETAIIDTLYNLTSYFLVPEAIRVISLNQVHAVSSCPCRALLSTCPLSEKLLTYYDFHPLQAEDTGHISFDPEIFYQTTQVRSSSSYVWCDVMGQRSAKHRPNHVLIDYLCPSSATAQQLKGNIRAHLSYIHAPKLDMTRREPPYDDYMRITCSNVPDKCVNAKDSTISICFTCASHNMCATRTFRENNNFWDSWLMLGRSIESRNNSLHSASYGSDDPILAAEEQVGSFSVYVRQDRIARYTTMWCGYGLDNIKETRKYNIADALKMAKMACLKSEVNLTAYHVPRERTVMCKAGLRLHSKLSSCELPSLTITITGKNGVPARKALLCSVQTDARERWPFLATADMDNGSSLKTFRNMPNSDYVDNKYCYYGNDGMSVVAVVFLPYMLDSQIIDETMNVKCVLHEAKHDIVDTLISVVGNTSVGCVPAPLFFIPTTRVLFNVDSTTITCGYPSYLKRVCLPEKSATFTIYLYYSTQFTAPQSIQIGLATGAASASGITTMDDINSTVTGVSCKTFDSNIYCDSGVVDHTFGDERNDIFSVIIKDIFIQDLIQQTTVSTIADIACATDLRGVNIGDIISLQTVVNRLTTSGSIGIPSVGAWRSGNNTSVNNTRLCFLSSVDLQLLQGLVTASFIILLLLLIGVAVKCFQRLNNTCREADN